MQVLTDHHTVQNRKPFVARSVCAARMVANERSLMQEAKCSKSVQFAVHSLAWLRRAVVEKLTALHLCTKN
jgi:hypothetical protein